LFTSALQLKRDPLGLANRFLMTPAEDAIAKLARSFHTRVRKANGAFGPEGVLVAETRFRRGPLRFTVFATSLRIIVEVRGFSRAPMKFSLNHPDRWSRGATPIDTVGTTTVLAYPRSRDRDALSHWLHDSYHRALLGALGLQHEECVHFYQNGLDASVLPDSAVPELVMRLEALVGALPSAADEGTLEGIAQMPSRLQELAPLFADWAISDDEERGRKIGHASLRRLRKVRDAVEPLLPEIDEYLRSFGKQPLTPAAMQLGDLAQAIAEIRAREA